MTIIIEIIIKDNCLFTHKKLSNIDDSQIYDIKVPLIVKRPNHVKSCCFADCHNCCIKVFKMMYAFVLNKRSCTA